MIDNDGGNDDGNDDEIIKAGVLGKWSLSQWFSKMLFWMTLGWENAYLPGPLRCSFDNLIALCQSFIHSHFTKEDVIMIPAFFVSANSNQLANNCSTLAIVDSRGEAASRALFSSAPLLQWLCFGGPLCSLKWLLVGDFNGLEKGGSFCANTHTYLIGTRIIG